MTIEKKIARGPSAWWVHVFARWLLVFALVCAPLGGDPPELSW
jgi:hypothetical protein